MTQASSAPWHQFIRWVGTRFSRPIDMSITEPTTHLVFLVLESWGHARPLCPLALRLVREHPMYITFFITVNMAARLEEELSRSFNSETKQLEDLVRVVALKVPDGHPFELQTFNAFHESFADAYNNLVNRRPITCSYTGKEIPAVVHPNAVIMDFFCVPALEAVRQLSKRVVKVYAWMSGQASYILYPFAPVSRGGMGDLRSQVTQKVLNTERPIGEVAEEIICEPRGAIIRTVGLPPMYDHELYPQQAPFKYKGMKGRLMMLAHAFFDQCDGLVLSTAEPIEPEAIAELSAWFSETSRHVYTLGPLLPLGENAAAGEEAQCETSAEIAHFMQKMFQSHGPNSMLYISFGSTVWCLQPDNIWTFLDVVMENNIPFLMSHASSFAIIPDAVRAKVKAYGKGLFSKWCPQQTILAHPVTGWFLTHAGQNSVLEAVAHGVPLICWPYNADQPTNSARLSAVLDVAYEVFEVRTGVNGLKPIYRIGKAPEGTIAAIRDEAEDILAKAFGEHGETKRANMRRLQKAVLSTWDEHGVASRDLRRFVASLQQSLDYIYHGSQPHSTLTPTSSRSL